MSRALFQTNIIRRLKYGVPPRIAAWTLFDEVMCDELDSICSYFGCEPEPIRINLLEAQEFWVDDIDNVAIEEDEKTQERLEPDHFKHAGWLCHWLRKKRPIGRLIIHDESKLQKYFEESYNEVCAFIIGLKIALFYECCERKMDDDAIVRVTQIGFLTEILPDIALYLNHKNVSPHAIYMIYKSIIHDSPLRQGN